MLIVLNKTFKDHLFKLLLQNVCLLWRGNIYCPFFLDCASFLIISIVHQKKKTRFDTIVTDMNNILLRGRVVGRLMAPINSIFFH